MEKYFFLLQGIILYHIMLKNQILFLGREPNEEAFLHSKGLQA